MGSFPSRQLNNHAVYWANPVPDGYGGYDWNDPVEISCRWVETSKIVTSSTGEEVTATVQVQVDQDLDVGGMLFLGTLDDLDSSEEADPALVTNAYSIVSFDKIPSIKGNVFFRKVYL